MSKKHTLNVNTHPMTAEDVNKHKSVKMHTAEAMLIFHAGKMSIKTDWNFRMIFFIEKIENNFC